MRILTSILKYSAVAFLTAVFSSCTSRDDVSAAFLKCDAPSLIVFDAEGNSQSSLVIVESNVSWNVSIGFHADSDEWLKTGRVTESSFELCAGPYNPARSRDTAYVTLSAVGVDDIIIKAVQVPGDTRFVISPDVSEVRFNADGLTVMDNGNLCDSMLFDVTTDLTDWEISLSPEDGNGWLSVRYDIEGGYFSLFAEPNNEVSAPEPVTVMASSVSAGVLRRIDAVQEAGGDVPMTDIRITGVEDGTVFTVVFDNNISRKGTLINGKLTVRGTSVKDSENLIYSIESETVPRVLIGRHQDETVLLAFDASGALAWRTSEDGRLLVNTVGELMNINGSQEFLNGSYLQESDLDLLGSGSYEGQPLSVRLDWLPIGSSTVTMYSDPYVDSYDQVFYGQYDGNGFVIRNMFSGRGTTCGLFGCVGEGAVVRNVNVESSILDGTKLNGFICVYNEGLIEDCVNHSDAWLSERSAGVCAVNGYNGRINTSVNKGHISGEVIIGGVCGFNFGQIVGCLNEGDIDDGDIIDGTRMGGITGVNYGTTSLCGNTGDVTGFGTMGGIAGTNNAQFGTEAVLTACWNEGTVTGRTLTAGDVSDIGGIAGSNSDGMISACVNRGDVNGVLYVGGVCGYHYRNTVTSCYNEGTVTGQEYVGGVMGYIGSDEDDPSVLASCYNLGDVSSYFSESMGGVCGENYGVVRDCWYIGISGLPGIGYTRDPMETYIFGADSWPGPDIEGWGIGTGEDGAYWKTLGKYVPGGTPDGINSSFPELYWEQ